MNSKEDLKKYVLSHGCCSPEENLRIYEEWFANSPRYLFRAVDRKYGITRKKLCDVGCAYGANLFCCASDSYGIEIDQEKVLFANSLGLKVYQRNIENEGIQGIPDAEVIWCSAVLEHVDSQYIFLTRLRSLLKQDGLLILYVPVIPLFPFLQNMPKIGKYVSGYRDKGHTMAFVPSTLKFICEQAGFKTIELSPSYPGFLSLLNHMPIANRLTGRCVYVGQKT